MDKYQAILAAMTPEQRMNLEEYIQVLENSKNPKGKKHEIIND